MSKEEKQEVREHAKLSASGSERWINCAGSYNAEKGLPNVSNKYADEGTLAHEIAAKCLENDLDPYDFEGYKGYGHIASFDMCRNVKAYCEYVKSFKGVLHIEKRVDFSHVVPEGFGTADALIYDETTKHLHVIDLKFGVTPVNAVRNTQGILYALGALYDYKNVWKVDNVSIHIMQPRLRDAMEWKVSYSDLTGYWHNYISSSAHEALKPDAKKTPSHKACMWCKAKPKCEALYSHTVKLLSSDIEDLGLLKELEKKKITDDQVKLLLDNADLIEKFLKSVKTDVHQRLLSGDKFQGYKLVKGKVNRAFTDEAEKVIVDTIGEDKAYNKKLIGITDTERLLKELVGKDTTKEIMKEITYKPEAPIVLAHEEDTRDSVEAVGAVNYFENLDALE